MKESNINIRLKTKWYLLRISMKKIHDYYIKKLNTKLILKWKK